MVLLPPDRCRGPGLQLEDRQRRRCLLSGGLERLPGGCLLRPGGLVPRAHGLRRQDADHLAPARRQRGLLRLLRALFHGAPRRPGRGCPDLAPGAGRLPGPDPRRPGPGPAGNLAQQPRWGGRPRGQAGSPEELLGRCAPAPRRDHGGMVDGGLSDPAARPRGPGGPRAPGSGRTSTWCPT